MTQLGIAAEIQGDGGARMNMCRFLVKNFLQWEWVMHRAHRYRTMYLASLDIKTAFDVAKPGTLAEMLKERRVHQWIIATQTVMHGWIIAALLGEMNGLTGKASFESCDTEFRLVR